MNHRFQRNSILGIDSTSGWVDKVDEVKREIKSHVETRFQELFYRRPSLRGSFFSKVE